MSRNRLYPFLLPLLLVSLSSVGYSCNCSCSNDVIGVSWDPEGLGVRSGTIAYAVRRGDYSDIYMADPDGSKRVRLTDDDTAKWGLAWSPDGTKLAYVSRDPHGGDTGIWVTGMSGTNIIMTGSGSRPAWSPDGDKIAYEAGGEIWVMNADGSNQRQLTDLYVFDGSGATGGTLICTSTPVWSADGTQIMFYKETWEVPPMHSSNISYCPEDYETWVMNADGSDQHELDDEDSFTACTIYPAWPSWMADKDLSPDGTRIVYRVLGAATFYIYVSNADGTDGQRLTDIDQYCVNPSWSPEGSLISYISRNSDSDCEELWVMKADGTNKVRITAEGEDCSSYAWVP